MDNETLKKLQETEFSILKEFHKYCNENGLRYYLIGGALLGAARYQSFIPWDDDVDVAMLREDYDKLALLWEQKGIDGYFLQHSKNNPLFARCIMKLRKNGTEIIEKTSEHVKINNGIYIDIFPIDYLPADFDQKKVAKNAKKIRRLMSLRSIKSGYSGKNKRLLKKILRACTFFISRSFVDKKIYKLCTRDNHKSRDFGILYLHNYDWMHQIHPVDVLGSDGKCVFCGQEFSAPKDMHLFLKKVFGESYMQEPPVEHQKNPHNYIKISFAKQEND